MDLIGLVQSGALQRGVVAGDTSIKYMYVTLPLLHQPTPCGSMNVGAVLGMKTLLDSQLYWSSASARRGVASSRQAPAIQCCGYLLA